MLATRQTLVSRSSVARVRCVRFNVWTLRTCVRELVQIYDITRVRIWRGIKPCSIRIVFIFRVDCCGYGLICDSSIMCARISGSVKPRNVGVIFIFRDNDCWCIRVIATIRGVGLGNFCSTFVSFWISELCVDASVTKTKSCVSTEASFSPCFDMTLIYYYGQLLIMITYTLNVIVHAATYHLITAGFGSIICHCYSTNTHSDCKSCWPQQFKLAHHVLC